MTNYDNARWYQLEAIDALFGYFYANQGNPLIALPTGSGKGYVIAQFLHRVYSLYPFQRVMVATHVKELIEQNYKKLMQVWPSAPAGIYSAGLKRKDVGTPITIAGIQSIRNVIERLGHIDLLIIDEAHLLGPSDEGSYMKVITALRAVNPHLKVIGLTATPWRIGMGLLTNGPIFTDIVYNICTTEGFARLFADYHLVPPRPKRVHTQIDTSQISINAGEFSQTGLQKAANAEVTWAALQEALSHGQDRHCRLVFATGIEHAILCAEMCNALGLRSAAVHSKMDDKERDAIMVAYRKGEIDTLCNNGIATTGLDHQPIDHIITLRSTMSVGLWSQMVGRGMRPWEHNGWRKLDCLVSDHGGNTARLGPIDDPLIPKLKGKGSGEAPVRICPACDCYNHASARVCAFCGELFNFEFKVKTKAYDDEIVMSDLPQLEWFRVDHVYYTQHTKRNAQPTDRPSIKATYHCGLRTFVEFVHIEAMGFARKKAMDWWKRRFPNVEIVPSTVNLAMGFVDQLIPPKRIEVIVNRKYPEVVGYEF
jgi:DNA repair protein RadD